MSQAKALVRQESPAQRLGTLYIASFFMVVALAGLGQYFVLRELSRQSSVARSVVELVGGGSSERPLSLAALAAVAEEDAGKRRQILASLGQVLEQQRGGAPGAASPVDKIIETEGPGSESSRLLARAAAGRVAASQAADRLLALFNGEGLARPSSAETTPHLQAILDGEEVATRAVEELSRAAGEGFVARSKRLALFQYELFGLLFSVLVLEGLFVVNPAVVKIRLFMRNMERSNDELENYARKLERSNKELQDFASVASHDLQEPLRKVQAFSDRLRSRCGAALDAQGREYLDRVQNAAARMQTLINDLLTYARVSTKAQPFVLTDLVTVTKEVVSDLEARIEQVNGTVEVGELPNLDADPLQVRQLMQNLIGNALKYKRPDVAPVVKISGIHPIKEPATLEGDATPVLCQIVVEDNGIGFEEIYAEKIFTIFQRLHGRAEYEGTGVGLAVCRKIVERHGGSITARSTPGRGSTFTVTLPMRQPKEKSADGCAA
jgi:signal transduction histidine kinase